MIHLAGRAGLVLVAILVLASARPACVAAQEVMPGGERVLVTPDLPPGHWAIRAALRAEALGLLERPVPFRRALSVETAAQVLEEARDAAQGGNPAIERLTEGWQQRFLREFGGLRGEGRARSLRVLGATGGAEVVSEVGRAAPGFGEIGGSRTGALPVEDELEVGLGGTVVAAQERVGVLVEPEVTTGGVRLERVDLVAGWEGWRVAVGRQPVGYGKARPGSLLLSGAVPLNRIEVSTERPAELGGVLGFLGPVGLELFVSRLREGRHEREPYLWGGSLSIQPFPRLGLAVQRAAMFGGHDAGEPLTLKTIVDMLIGRVRGLGFEDQIVSVEARYRLPTEKTIPLTAYLEWGAEDAAGGWWDVPGIMGGLETPAIPGLEKVAAGAAYTYVAPQCCYNSPWYRHGAFPGNWAEGDRPLGHPLGGQGSEWLAYGSFDDVRRGVWLDARLFRREREGQNLYVPGRRESTGVAVEARWRPPSRRFGRQMEATARLGVESGSGWTEHALGIGAIVYF